MAESTMTMTAKTRYNAPPLVLTKNSGTQQLRALEARANTQEA
jgi:hypothetical protein